MTKGLVTCKKCGNTFVYEKHDGVCPKCCRFYSTTRYNEEEALLKNILAPADEDKCSYHGGHDRSSGLSGHSEMLHSTDTQRQFATTAQTTYQRQNARTTQNISNPYHDSFLKSSSAKPQKATGKAKLGIIWLIIVIISVLLQALASGGN